MDSHLHSDLLKAVLDGAGKLSDTGDSITPEALLYSAVKYVNSKEDGDEEFTRVKSVIRQTFPDLAKAEKNLEAALRSNESPDKESVPAVLKRKEISASISGGKVTLDSVLTILLTDPTDGIARCIKNQNNPEPAETGGEESDLMKSIRAVSKKLGLSDDGRSENGAEAQDENGEQAEAGEKTPLSADEIIPSLVSKINKIRDELLTEVFGQDHAIDVLTDGLFQGEYLARTTKNRKKPKATFLFAGSPGVGKTMLATLLGDKLGIYTQRFDMSEYAMSSIQSDLAHCVKRHPKALLIFDEIEKAHVTTVQNFLQVLDLGQIGGSDGPSFRDCILIFTTNAGKSMYEFSESGDFSDVPTKMIVSALSEDVDFTGRQVFPAPLCSRFESGNVVMFNRMPAHILRRIAGTVIQKQTASIAAVSNIQVDIEDKVYTSLLFGVGGHADARMVSSKAERFVNSELYELFRLRSSDDAPLHDIRIRTRLPLDKPEIRRLFINEEKPQVLVFADEATCNKCAALCPDAEFVGYQDAEKAKDDIYKKDYKLVLLDFAYGQTGNSHYINDEDIESVGREFFRSLREKFAEMPVYFLQKDGQDYDTEERLSLQRRGVRDVIELPADGSGFAGKIVSVCEQVYCQEMLQQLARSSKMLAYETGQRIEADGSATIELFDFRFEKVIESRDAGSVLSDSELPTTRFKDVIGAGEAKKELQSYIDFLKNPKRHAAEGETAPKGILLYGPPGTGKTMLARALAGEAGVAFLPVSAASFMDKYVGGSQEKVRNLFAAARRYAPSVIFIDEIDAIGKERTGSEFTHVEEDVLNQLLTEMDGFAVDPKRPVFVLAATNYDVDGRNGSAISRSLDPALLRRFDRRILVDLPNQEERVEYLKSRTQGNRKFNLSESLYLNIAKRSVGMSPANLESIIKMALRSASRAGVAVIDDRFFEDAFEEFQSGEEHPWPQDVVLRTARHECGHAFLCWYYGDKPSYMTIVSRGNYGGYVMPGNDEERFGRNRAEMLHSICTALGGRAAELVYYGDEDGVTTGPSSDLRNATNTAVHMLCSYGMSDRFGLAAMSPYSNKDGALLPEVREEVNRILSEQLDTATAMIRANQEAMDALVDAVMEKSHLTGEEIDAVLSAHAKQAAEE